MSATRTSDGCGEGGREKAEREENKQARNSNQEIFRDFLEVWKIHGKTTTAYNIVKNVYNIPFFAKKNIKIYLHIYE